MDENFRAGLIGAAVGAIGLPSLLLAYPIGIEVSTYALHHADEACGLGLFVIPVIAVVLAIVGLPIGAYAGRLNDTMLRTAALRIALASAVLAVAGFTYHAVTYKAPATPVVCYI